MKPKLKMTTLLILGGTTPSTDKTTFQQNNIII